SVLYIAAMTAVIVVPIFAPMINGKDLAKLTLRLATSGTIRLVVTVLDCIAAVKNTPYRNDKPVFLKMTLLMPRNESEIKVLYTEVVSTLMDKNTRKIASIVDTSGILRVSAIHSVRSLVNIRLYS